MPAFMFMDNSMRGAGIDPAGGQRIAKEMRACHPPGDSIKSSVRPSAFGILTPCLRRVWPTECYAWRPSDCAWEYVGFSRSSMRVLSYCMKAVFTYSANKIPWFVRFISGAGEEKEKISVNRT
jgi:hypothetical protein